VTAFGDLLRWRAPSLRGLVFLLVGAAAAYAGAVTLYLTISVGSAAFTLGEGTTAIVALQDDLGHRQALLNVALDRCRELLSGTRAPSDTAVDRLRGLIGRGSVRERAEPYAHVPAELRVALARADEQLSRFGNALSEMAALIELRRIADGRRALDRVDALAEAVEADLATTSELARADLMARQEALRRATRHAVRDGLLLLAAGMFFLPLALLVVRRRVWTPLARLEEGLQHVSEGDLTAEVAVHSGDELGRVATHFNHMTGVLRDRAEEQGRFAAAGELLAGVAHEVNNPLMAIATHAELRLADSDLTNDARVEMQSILRQARRASKLLRGLLRFVRAGEKRAAHVNLNDVVRSAIDLVSYRFTVDEIIIDGRLDPSLPAVHGDANRLEQVLVNLLSNALDALRHVKPPRRLAVDSFVTDGRVCVTVTDNGPGVAAEIVERLFRPFATTKGRRGTGLGLYISRQLIREAAGDLGLDPAPAPGGGSGARFLLWLPAAPTLEGPAPEEDVPPAATPAPAPAPVPPPGGSLAGIRVLLVDDEEMIRRPMVRFLARRGAEVTEAGDGLQALERLAGFDPHVIVADLRMPKMDGAELYSRLQAERPPLAERVLFLSGDITQLAGRGLAPVPRERVLVKPVELAELERRILEFVRESKAG
jgi:signal transduction histidine kinase/CheY-like chemotaxis protein